MKPFHIILSLCFLIHSIPTLASEIWFQPTEYLGPRNNNPYLQAYFGTEYLHQTPTTFVMLHYEAEMIGTRHDFTFDLDRAYFKMGDFYFGRAHLWDLTGFRPSNDRFGMLAQFQPINLGIQLDPILIAPIGVHYVHEWTPQEKIAFSVSPLAVPNLGSEVTLSENSVSTNRFGRLPPGSAEINGILLPIRYRIEAGNLFSDILLKPNFAGIYLNQWNERTPFALGFSIAPDPNPRSEVTSSFVQAGQEELTAVAVVHPTFPYRAQAYFTQTYLFPETPFSVEADFLIRNDSVKAVEALAKWGSLFYLAYAQSFPETLYLDHLLRAGANLNITSQFSSLFSVKRQLNQEQSIWFNSEFHFKPEASTLDFYLALDVFGGADRTYYGEWRTNDRAYGGLIARY